MSESIVSVLAPAVPHVLWVVFFSGVLLLIGPARIRDVVARVSSVELSGVKIDLESRLVSAAVARQIQVPREATRMVAESYGLRAGVLQQHAYCGLTTIRSTT